MPRRKRTQVTVEITAEQRDRIRQAANDGLFQSFGLEEIQTQSANNGGLVTEKYKNWWEWEDWKLPLKRCAALLATLLCLFLFDHGCVGLLDPLRYSSERPGEQELEKAKQVEIVVPRDGSVVSRQSRTSVQLKDVYVPEGFHLYMFEWRSTGLIWPKEENIDSPGFQEIWKTKVGFGGEESGEFEMRLYLVSPRGHRRIQRWFTWGHISNTYAGTDPDDIPGAIYLGKSVTLKQ